MWFRKRPAPWPPNPDLDDSVLVWRAVVRHGLTRRRSVLHPFGRGVGLRGLAGGLGAGTGGRLFTGPAADALASAQQAAIRDSTSSEDGVDAWLGAMEFAALELSDRLDEAERVRLRATGELPDWFPASLKVRANEIRKSRRSREY